MACRIWVSSLMKADYSSRLLLAQDSALRAANVNRVAELFRPCTVPMYAEGRKVGSEMLAGKGGRKTWRDARKSALANPLPLGYLESGRLTKFDKMPHPSS